METNENIIKLMKGRGYSNKTTIGNGKVWVKKFDDNSQEIIDEEIIRLIWINAQYEANK